MTVIVPLPVPEVAERVIHDASHWAVHAALALTVIVFVSPASMKESVFGVTERVGVGGRGCSTIVNSFQTSFDW